MRHGIPQPVNTLSTGEKMHKEGEILQNRYRILRLESEGGMSYVYKVEDQRLNKCWALKELKADGEFLDNSVEYTQFKTEARILADMSHPAFPVVIDFFLDDRKAYLVEEWIEGKTLETLGTEGLQEARVRDFALQILDALDHIHKNGIIYRDLKPQNIMVTTDNRIKLIDFGIARFYKAGKRKDTVLAGTPGYAPPEQYGQGQTDIRTDIYSLGASLYFMITGGHPPEERFDMELPDEYRSRCSPELRAALKKAMKERPEERFQTVDEFRESLTPRHERKKEASLILATIICSLILILVVAEARVPSFYLLLVFVLIYGFIWALREIRKRS
jgi:serine/threonine protein kinase